LFAVLMPCQPHSKYVVQILPSMVVAPVFFKGKMELGAISQT